MKHLNKIIIVIAALISLSGVSYATNPTYTLNATNFVLTNPNSLEFDIYIKHTNPGSTSLVLLNAQYFFKFDPAYANGGTLSFSFVPGSSDLPTASQPRSPNVKNDELRLACNAPFPISNAPVILSSGSGTRIMRMKLTTTTSSFAGNLNLRWKNIANKGYYTTLSSLLNGNVFKLTDSTSHYVGAGLPGIINIKLALEGFYSAGSNSMNRNDTVSAYLRSNVSPFQKIDSSKAVIDSSTFTGSFSFANAPTGTYYIQIIHRNSIETWSKTGGATYTQGGNMNYDFTTAASQSYGSNMVQIDAIPVSFGIYTGDSNQDGTVDASDIVQIYNSASNFESGYLPTDLNGDDFVDVTDLVYAYNNASQFVSAVTP